MWGGATFDVAYRFLHESPWERLDLIRQKAPNMPFQMLLRGANAVGYTNYPDNVIREFIREAARSGMDVFRIFDSLNWIPGMEVAMDEVLKQGKILRGHPLLHRRHPGPDKRQVHPQYYVNMAKELEKRGAHMLAIKDMAGLLKPYAAKKLVSALKQEVGIPIQLHTHDTSGNQVAAVLMAAEAGRGHGGPGHLLHVVLHQPALPQRRGGGAPGQERDTGLDLDRAPDAHGLLGGRAQALRLLRRGHQAAPSRTSTATRSPAASTPTSSPRWNRWAWGTASGRSRRCTAWSTTCWATSSR
jgi:pyruvate carboxylase